MPIFRTQLALTENNLSINYEDSILALGSCFVENIGQLLESQKFNTLLNPFGILYNPISIANALEHIINQKLYSEKDIFYHQEQWHSFDHHSQFSAMDKTACLEKINNSVSNAHQFLSTTNRLIITLGTAHVFVHNTSQQIVANCHKLPNHTFTRKRLSTKAIIASLSSLFEKLRAKNPQLEIITTVSPIRHIRDGLIENQRSKASLILALDTLCQQHSYVHYFPAYELVVDDLRDYRFYEADMIHPSKVAIDYISSYFYNNYFTEETRKVQTEVNNIIKASLHRAFQVHSSSHQQFINKQLELINLLNQRYPYLNFAKEEKLFRQQLIS